MIAGATLFAEQLRALGHAAVVDGDWVEFDYSASVITQKRPYKIGSKPAI